MGNRAPHERGAKVSQDDGSPALSQIAARLCADRKPRSDQQPLGFGKASCRIQRRTKGGATNLDAGKGIGQHVPLLVLHAEWRIVCN
ncbi:hypothetical protein AEMCBJ_32015 (plasmid) [Cupriavidus necator]